MNQNPESMEQERKVEKAQKEKKYYRILYILSLIMMILLLGIEFNGYYRHDNQFNSWPLFIAVVVFVAYHKVQKASIIIEGLDVDTS